MAASCRHRREGQETPGMGCWTCDPLLHPREVCASEKLTGGAKKRCSEVPSCVVLCPFLLASPPPGHRGAARVVFARRGAVTMPVTALSWRTRLHSCSRVRDADLVGGANSQSLLHPSLFKWEKIRAVEPIALMTDSIILNDNCKKSVSIIKKKNQTPHS